MSAGLTEVPLNRACLRGCKPLAVETCRRRGVAFESGCLKVQSKAGDKLHLRLNIAGSPIANKYREGKLERTLKREFNRT